MFLYGFRWFYPFLSTERLEFWPLQPWDASMDASPCSSGLSRCLRLGPSQPRPRLPRGNDCCWFAMEILGFSKVNKKRSHRMLNDVEGVRRSKFTWLDSCISIKPSGRLMWRPMKIFFYICFACLLWSWSWEENFTVWNRWKVKRCPAPGKWVQCTLCEASPRPR
jgi:hypothetical protein